jgi:hypothetical protein
LLSDCNWNFKLSTLHKHFLTRFGGRNKKQTTYNVICTTHKKNHLYRGLSRRDYIIMSLRMSVQNLKRIWFLGRPLQHEWAKAPFGYRWLVGPPQVCLLISRVHRLHLTDLAIMFFQSNEPPPSYNNSIQHPLQYVFLPTDKGFGSKGGNRHWVAVLLPRGTSSNSRHLATVLPIRSVPQYIILVMDQGKKKLTWQGFRKELY